MKIFSYAVLTVLGFTVLTSTVFALKSRKPLKCFLLNALAGLFALAAIDLTTRLTGVHLPVNEWTAGASAALGPPAVAGLLLLPLILK